MEELKTEWNLEVCKACCDFELSVLLLVNENDEIIHDYFCFNLNKLSDVSSVDNTVKERRLRLSRNGEGLLGRMK